ncbi:MAG: NAD(P)H-binding protein [Verrucomicrobia bacterium]|nr:NAD(P)H-binding protein [Verrucomicrobiota bacterium]
MKPQFCIIGATHGTGLLIAQQLLQGGSSARVIARDPDKAIRLLGNRADVRQGDVTDARSMREALTENYRVIFFNVAVTGGVDGRGLFASKTRIRNATYQGLLNVVDAARSRDFEGRIMLSSLVGVDRASLVINILDKIKSGLLRNLVERELYLRASGLDYTVVRAPILTNAPAGEANIRITRAINKLTAGSRISSGDLARVMVFASQQAGASRKTFDLFAAKGSAPSDERLLQQLKEVPADTPDAEIGGCQPNDPPARE